jgi:hypothetical protein
MMTPARTSTGAFLDDDTARPRLMNRLAIGLLLDLIAIARGEDGHLLDTLLASAIIHANIQEILRRADLNLAFADETAMPPDELRRPISMNALATSLELPFETVRRRVGGMVRDGFCKFVDGGVIVPSAVLDNPQYLADGFRGYERIRGFYYQASDLGILTPLPPPTVELRPDTFPIRAVARLVGTYVLRVVERMGALGDLVDGLIALEIYRCNVETLSIEEASGAPEAALDGVIDEGQRQPVPITGIAQRMGMPHETVRRHVRGLMDRGVCHRRPTGLVVPSDALAGPALGTLVADNAANLQRLFGSLSQLGVLQVWDGIRPPA